jgi:hypothetical protein
MTRHFEATSPCLGVDLLMAYQEKGD